MIAGGIWGIIPVREGRASQPRRLILCTQPIITIAFIDTMTFPLISYPKISEIGGTEYMRRPERELCVRASRPQPPARSLLSAREANSQLQSQPTNSLIRNSQVRYNASKFKT